MAEKNPPPASPTTDEPPAKPRLITRRRVLLAAGGVVGTALLGAGGVLLYDERQRFGRDVEQSIGDHRVSLSTVIPRMVIAHGLDVARTVRAAIERMGGLQQLIAPSDVVLIKPNIGWMSTPEQGANTHPEVVAELVRLCRATNAKRVLVADCPVRKSRGAFERSGILAAASEAGAEVFIPEETRHVTVRISERLGTWDVIEPFVVATKIINVPVAKHHPLLGATAGMKNWIGITNRLRLVFHNDLHQSIAELAALMRPTLTVVDATRVLMANGPQGGSLDDVKSVQTVVASLDPVAADAWACEAVGVAPAALPHFLELTEGMGLGQRDYRALQPVEVMAG